MFCCTLLYVHSSIAIILMGKRELVVLLILSSWCLVMVELLFLAVPRGCLRFVIVVFPDHTHLLFFSTNSTPEKTLHIWLKTVNWDVKNQIKQKFGSANSVDPDEMPHSVAFHGGSTLFTKVSI